VLDHLDARAARRWVVDALEQLTARREEIDALNVFPVPDSDTGTNLCLTVEAGAAEVDHVPDDDGLGEVTDAFARGALLGARGSSGVILSQLLRGWADAFRERPDGGPAAVRAALTRAAEQAYAAVARPVEGTMLSVARAAAEGAEGRTLKEVVSGAVTAARTALGRTTEQLDVLHRAGVVDAGGRGLLVLLESLSATVHGWRDGGKVARSGPVVPRPSTEEVCETPPLSGVAYEVMYLLETTDDTVTRLRSRLDQLGEALVVVGGNGLWNVHVHTDEVAAIVAAGGSAGRVRRLRVTSFARQRYERERTAAVLAESSEVLSEPSGVSSGPVGSVVPVVVDAPLECVALLADHGAQVVPSAFGATSHELCELARSLAAAVAFVPATVGATEAAGRAAELLRRDGHDVHVLPSRSFVQALAAVSVHDAALGAQAAVARMADAAGEVRWGEVLLGADGAVGFVAGAQAGAGDPAAVAGGVVHRLLDRPAELLTVLPRGAADVHGPVVDAVLRQVERHHAGVEVTVLPAAAEAGPGLELGAE
jgi:DAK2 domain fusion protein YloV